MKAYVLHGIDDLRREEVKLPRLKPDEVLVEVRAAGICGSDIPRIYRTGTYSFPLIPGHEFSGIVVQTGRDADKRRLGKRVGVYPLIPCMECGPCGKGRYELCRKYSYLGSRADGGFAGFAAVPEQNLIELPEFVSYEAAAMLEPMAVAVHAMRRAGAGTGRIGPMAVCGLGTVGILLAMFLKEAGIENIYLIGNKESQKEMVTKAGFPEWCYADSRVRDVEGWLKSQTGGAGADVFFECAGTNDTVSMAINCTAPEGIIQLVGNPASDMTFRKSTYWKLLRSQLTVKGSWNSSFTHSQEDDWHYVLKRLAAGRVAPEQLITHRLAFDELEKGLHIMRDKSEDYVKVMITR